MLPDLGNLRVTLRSGDSNEVVQDGAGGVSDGTSRGERRV